MGKERVNVIITKQSLRFALVKRGQADNEIEAFEVMLPKGTMKHGAIADYDKFTETVASIVREHKLRRKKLAFCLVDDTVYIQEVTIPGVLTEAECIAYIETQTGFDIELPFDDSVVTVDVLQQTTKSTRVRFYAYPKDRIETFKQAFSDAGLVPIIADLTSLSVYRHYEQSVTTPTKHVLLVHWNRDALYLTAFDRNKAVFSRHLRMDLEGELTPDTSREAIMPFIMDITRTLDFYHDSVIKGRAQVEELIVSGDFPYLYDVKHLLNETLGLPIYAFKKKDLRPTRKSTRTASKREKEKDATKPAKKPRTKSTRSTRGIPVHLERESNRDMQQRVKYMDLFGLSRKVYES